MEEIESNLSKKLLSGSINCEELDDFKAEKTAVRRTCGCFQMRFLVVFLATFGCFNIYAMRVCLGMALVCMVNHTAILKPSDSSGSNDTVLVNCPAEDHFIANDTGQDSFNEDGPFVWDEHVQGIILSSFFWGYLTTQLLGGFASDKFGGKWIWALSMLVSSIATIMIPWAASRSATMIIILRIICGVAQGMAFPSLYAIMSKWYPHQERSMLVTLSQVGCSIGNMVSFPVSATLCKSSFAGGWPAIFYLFGGLGIVLFLLWSFIMTNYPAENSWISEEEIHYIEKNRQCRTQQQTVRVPWVKIFTSVPFLALCVHDFSSSFKFFMLLTQLPTYLKVVLNFDVEQNGVINLVPYGIGAVISILASWWADVMLRSQTWRTGTIRKALTLSGNTIACICLLGAIWSGCNRTGIILFLWVALSIDGLGCGGTEMNPFDLSPNFVGTLKGILNTCVAAGGIAAPYVVGLLTYADNSQAGWNKAFYMATGLYLFGTLAFGIFGSGKIQKWNDVDEESDPLLLPGS